MKNANCSEVTSSFLVMATCRVEMSKYLTLVPIIADNVCEFYFLSLINIHD